MSDAVQLLERFGLITEDDLASLLGVGTSTVRQILVWYLISAALATLLPRVVVADVGREFAFVTGHRGRDMTKWTYRFDPVVGGTRVVESFEMLRDMPWYFRMADRYLMGVKDRREDLVANMEATLRRLGAATVGADGSHCSS